MWPCRRVARARSGSSRTWGWTRGLPTSREASGSATWCCAAVDRGNTMGTTKEIAMKPIMISVARALPALLFLGATCAFAQEARQGVAQLKDVHGNVLVSKESGLASGDESLRLTKGARVITTSRSDVVVVFDNGCEVRLKENQRLEIDAAKPCSELVAQAQSILAEPAGAAAAGAAGPLWGRSWPPPPPPGASCVA